MAKRTGGSLSEKMMMYDACENYYITRKDALKAKYE